MESKRGTAGLKVLVTIIFVLFTIGVLVMVFALMGGSILGTTDAGSQASQVVNDTTGSISSTTTWFPVIIVLSVVVVLILLTVMIIVAVRSSGLIAEDSA